MIKEIKDQEVSKEELAKASGNPNKIFNILFGKERREIFKKYGQDQHRFKKIKINGEDIDFNKIETWTRPVIKGTNEYYDQEDFDRMVKDIETEDERRREFANQSSEENSSAEEELARQRELAIQQNKTEVINHPDVQLLGRDGKYNVYKVNSYEGMHNFALRRSQGKGWCISGSEYWGTGPDEGPSYWRGQVGNGQVYVFQTTPEKDSLCLLYKGENNWTLWINSTDTQVRIPDDLPLYINGLPEIGNKNYVQEGPFVIRGGSLIRVNTTTANTLDIPASVTSLSARLFENNRYLEYIRLKSSMTNIFYRAFYGCSNLKDIVIESNHLSIEKETFAYCSKLQKINLQGVNVIPEKALYNCDSLNSIVISPNLTSIGKDAFLGCSQLLVIEIPNTCTKIDTNAFFRCKDLVIRTTFTERPEGWYKDIENHVKAIEYAKGATEDSSIDTKVLDVEPKKGENKEDFISRFMSETKEEYPDQKRRLAVAYSYWNKKKTKVNDSEVYSLWDLFHNNDCAGWIIKMDDNPNLCVFSNSNNLSFLEEDEESMSDRIVLEEKREIAPNLFIYIGHSDAEGVFNSKTFESDELANIEEAVEDIKKSWPQVNEVQDSKKKIADDYYNGSIPRNAWEIFVCLYSTGDYQRNIPDDKKIQYCILPKQKAYWKTNKEDFYKSDISKSSMMLYGYPQDTLEDVERVAQDIINKCGARPVSESEYLALKNEDEDSRVSEIFANFEARKMNDSEMVVNTCQKDEDITPEEQEVKEIVVNFSIQALAKEAKDDLKTAQDEQQLEIKYNNWLSKSDEWLNEGKITISQQEEFEDELWDCYNDLLD